MQANIVQPLVDRYGLVHVSYKDAVWPSVDHRPPDELHLYDTYPPFFPFHPRWYNHQLIADCLCYAWAAVDDLSRRDSQGRADNINKTLPPVPPALHGRHGSSVLEPCEGGWKTVLRFARSHAQAEDVLQAESPVDAPGGWMHITDQAHKGGWQYDARSMSNATTSEYSGRARALEPISFRMRFGNEPRLLVTYLRSYENFGRALVWIDDDKQAALERTHTDECFTSTCARKYPNPLKQNATRAGMLFCPDLQPPAAGVFFNQFMPMSCQGKLAAPGAPFVLDGWWGDRSSQAYSKGFRSGFSQHVVNSLWGRAFYVENASTSLLPPNGSNPAFRRPTDQHDQRHGQHGATRSRTREEHLVSIAMLSDPGVHAYLTGVQAHQRPLFKLLALHSC